MLLRRATGDQAGNVVQLLRILVDKAEGQLQPVAVGLGLVGDDGVQVAVEPRDFGVVALLKVEHGAFQHLRQDLATLYHQQRFLDAQGLDHALLGAACEAQLALTATASRRRCGGGLDWRCIEQTFAGRRHRGRLDRFGFAAGQGAQGVVAKG